MSAVSIESRHISGVTSKKSPFGAGAAGAQNH
jgi:hypothetical protein